MPFNELSRRESWPPATILLQHEVHHAEAGGDSIDENPFSFFLTRPDDVDSDELFSSDNDDDTDLSAGIETPDEQPPVRTVSPSSLQRSTSSNSLSQSTSHIEHSDYDDDEAYIRDLTRALSMPLALDDFSSMQSAPLKIIRRQPYQPRDPSPHRQADRPRPSLRQQYAPATPTLRGRATLSPSGRHDGQIRGRGRGQTRSVPARKPHSWREPSPDVWSIPEEGEESEERGEGDAEMDDVPLLSLDERLMERGKGVGGEYSGVGAMDVPKRKIVKKVRFASLP